MVKIDINGNTISNPITNRYNSDLSTISSQADLVERWTNGTNQPSSGYYIFEKSSNFDSILTNNFTTLSVQAPYENWASSCLSPSQSHPSGSVVNASRDYRTSFTATVQFTSDNTWTYTTDVSGTMETYTYTTSYNFSSKNSIDFMYHMINSRGYSYEMLGNLIPGTTNT